VWDITDGDSFNTISVVLNISVINMIVILSAEHPATSFKKPLFTPPLCCTFAAQLAALLAQFIQLTQMQTPYGCHHLSG